MTALSDHTPRILEIRPEPDRIDDETQPALKREGFQQSLAYCVSKKLIADFRRSATYCVCMSHIYLRHDIWWLAYNEIPGASRRRLSLKTKDQYEARLRQVLVDREVSSGRRIRDVGDLTAPPSPRPHTAPRREPRAIQVWSATLRVAPFVTAGRGVKRSALAWIDEIYGADQDVMQLALSWPRQPDAVVILPAADAVRVVGRAMNTCVFVEHEYTSPITDVGLEWYAALYRLTYERGAEIALVVIDNYGRGGPVDLASMYTALRAKARA